jgi:hypothetical protein
MHSYGKYKMVINIIIFKIKGKLMCETRNENKRTSAAYKSSSKPESEAPAPTAPAKSAPVKSDGKQVRPKRPYVRKQPVQK